MKSKKPFLIVCAAALTLALLLPFIGVFAFAEDSGSLSFSIDSRNTSQYLFVRYGLSSGSVSNFTVLDLATNNPSSVSVSLSLKYAIEVNSMSNWGSAGQGFVYYDGTLLSFTSSEPTHISDLSSLTFACTGSGSGHNYYYFIVDPLPPDPFAPVSDGMDTMISVFGDVIDYIINTPDVAIFVAISVASCAIIPMGIILIKKLIKGY